MKQTTKFLHIVMCMVLGLSVSMTSCKDYDDDIDGLNQRGSHCLTLEVRASNAPARKLYEKLGFVQVGIRPNYYQHPREDGLILRKEWER